MECPEFDSTKGSYGLVSRSNDADGNLVETYEINVNENVLTNHKTFTFSINNAINTEYARTFVLRGGVDPSELRYGDIIYDDGSVVHLDEQPLSGSGAPVAVGVVVYKSDSEDGELACQKGSINEDSEEVVGKAIVIALRHCAENTTEYLTSSYRTYAWATTVALHPNSVVPGTTTKLFPYYGNNKTTCEGDFYGYEKTLQMVKKTGECASHSHPAAVACYYYDQKRAGTTDDTYLVGSTGWFLPSIGQVFKMTIGLAKGGNATGGDKNIATYNGYEVTPSNTAGHSTGNNLKSLIERAGATFIEGSWKCVSSVEATDSGKGPYDYNWWVTGQNGYGLYWTGQNPYTNSNWDVQAILCY